YGLDEGAVIVFAQFEARLVGQPIEVFVRRCDEAIKAGGDVADNPGHVFLLQAGPTAMYPAMATEHVSSLALHHPDWRVGPSGPRIGMMETFVFDTALGEF